MPRPWFPITIFFLERVCGNRKMKTNKKKCYFFISQNLKTTKKTDLFKYPKVVILCMKLNSIIVMLKYILSCSSHPSGLSSEWYHDTKMNKIEIAFIVRVNIILYHCFLCFFVLNYGKLVFVIFILSKGNFTNFFTE